MDIQKMFSVKMMSSIFISLRNSVYANLETMFYLWKHEQKKVRSFETFITYYVMSLMETMFYLWKHFKGPRESKKVSSNFETVVLTFDFAIHSKIGESISGKVIIQ